ncbi:unnamed protein product [Blepharisma stoltei]|uniref:Uncharacterized protein n=1 Tax=Blepharisma stoltei TaxID=1481888 RepID=A0AAU9K2E0_9CILI|nr:unnamed protein product [Blepharisma stoltei]
MQFEAINTSIQKSPLRSQSPAKFFQFAPSFTPKGNSGSSNRKRRAQTPNSRKAQSVQLQSFNINIPGATPKSHKLRFVDYVSSYLDRKTNEISDNKLPTIFTSLDMNNFIHPKSLPRSHSSLHSSKILKIEINGYEKFLQNTGFSDKPTPYARSYTPKEISNVTPQSRPMTGHAKKVTTSRKSIKRRMKENLPVNESPRKKYKKLIQDTSFALEKESLMGWQ